MLGSSPSPGKPPLPQIRTRQASTDSTLSGRSHSNFNSNNNNNNNSNNTKTNHTSEDVLDREERAELGLIANLEHRRSHSKTPSGDVWYSAVEGERPPLHSIPSHATAAMESTTGSTYSGSLEGSTAPKKLRDLARRVMEMNRPATTNTTTTKTAPGMATATTTASVSSVGSSDSGSHTTKNSKQHKRRTSRAHQLLGMIQEENNETDTDENKSSNNSKGKGDESTQGLFGKVGGDAHLEQGDSLFSIEGTNTDRLFAGASVVNDLFDPIEETPSENSGEAPDETTANYLDDQLHHNQNYDEDDNESRPLRSLDQNDSIGYGSSANSGANGSHGNNMRLARKKKKTNWQKMRQRVCYFFHPERLIASFCQTMESAYFVMASVPIFFS